MADLPMELAIRTLGSLEDAVQTLTKTEEIAPPASKPEMRALRTAAMSLAVQVFSGFKSCFQKEGGNNAHVITTPKKPACDITTESESEYDIDRALSVFGTRTGGIPNLPRLVRSMTKKLKNSKSTPMNTSLNYNESGAGSNYVLPHIKSKLLPPAMMKVDTSDKPGKLIRKLGARTTERRTNTRGVTSKKPDTRRSKGHGRNINHMPNNRGLARARFTHDSIRHRHQS